MLPEWFYKLGLMGWPLALSSILVLAISCERIVFLIKRYTHQEREYQHFADYLCVYKMVPKQVRDEAVSLAVQELQPSYFSGIRFLRILGAMSPMLGLLGTILGIMKAFHNIAGTTGAIAPHMIASGLWEAMLTTAFGLGVALPALFMAHILGYFSERRLSYLCYRLNKLSLSFVQNPHD